MHVKPGLSDTASFWAVRRLNHGIRVNTGVTGPSL